MYYNHSRGYACKYSNYFELYKQIEPALKDFDFGFIQVHSLCKGRPAGDAAANLRNDGKGLFFGKKIGLMSPVV